jgi:DNA-binding response OmpR family regulator
LDVTLPDGNGLDWIKTKKINANIILITGIIEEMDLESVGFHIIRKPFILKGIIKYFNFSKVKS